MTRKKKLFFNTSISLADQIITIVCGFILPRLILSYFGSEVNGLVSSITQFLGFISLAECGVGAVVASTLYKPLAEKDNDTISRIIISAEHFFRKVAILLVFYTLILMFVYPLITLESFDYFYTLSLILVISISSFAEYYFSMTYRILLRADQMAFISLGLHSIILILNTLISVLLMKVGLGIHVVKFTSSLLFLIQPLGLTTFIKKYYKINKKLILTEEPIKQKWNGLAQHVAGIVLVNTDTVVLTLFSTLQNVSIYSVYHMVVEGVKRIVMSTTTGMQAMLGNMYAKNEDDVLKRSFSFFEWLLHTVTVFTFSCTGILILPFVKVYTANITDVNYFVPVFAVLITLAQASYCLRLPYNIMVLAAGHYKQTQLSAIIEMLINIIFSIALVNQFGLIGVSIGTLLAMSYRTVYLAWYLKNNILYREFRHFVKHLIVDAITVLIIIAGTRWININVTNYILWIKEAIIVALISLAIIVIINLVFYYHFLMQFAKKIIGHVRKRSNK